MSVKIYIGDVTSEVAAQAQLSDPAAFLLSFDNFKEFLTHTPSDVTVYTSLGDLPNDQQIIEILDLADTITYCPPEKNWTNERMRETTESLLMLFVKFKNKAYKNAN